MKTDNSRYWPTCYSSQRDAGIDPGPLDYPDTDDHSADHLDMFALGWGIGLLFGLALPDLLAQAARWMA